MEALNIECKKYQENLYGSVVASSADSADPPIETLRLDCAQGGDAGLQRSSSQSSSGRQSTDSQASDHSEFTASSSTPDRQNINNPSHLAYAHPHFSSSSLSSDSGRNSQSTFTPPSNAPQYMVFNPPFAHPFSHRDQRFHGCGFPGLPGMPSRGDSVFGAFGNRPRTFDPHYSPIQVRSFRPPLVGGSMLTPPLVNFPGSGTRSPIPFASYPQTSNYYSEAFPGLSTSQQHFVGSNVEEQAINMHHLNQTNTRGSSIGVLNMPFYNNQDVLVGHRSQSPYLHAGFSQENLTADVLTFSGTPAFELPISHAPQQPNYPGSSTSSGPSSMIGEDLAYLQGDHLSFLL